MAPVDHNNPVPVALKTVFPQLFVTVTTGADGAAGSTNEIDNGIEEQDAVKVME